MASRQAVVIREDGSVEVRHVETDLDTIKGVVGGWLEMIAPNRDTGHPGWHGYVDEEGKLKRLPMNVAATRIARALGWDHDDVLCGPVVLFGEGVDGDEGDVPADVVDFIHGYAWRWAQ